MLDAVFEQIANILLQLFQLDFSRIGAVSKDLSLDTWSVTRRPLTYSMNELAITAFYPLDELATGLFESRNLSSTATEAEEQYVARYLFARLVDKHCIHDNGTFKLFCDDLWP
ncbi:hypothetical protein E5D57_007180 [Metarhizium anisopliae]|nr:hypothetical protein E5D57_007180 [Metarhizium anisopliae]